MKESHAARRATRSHPNVIEQVIGARRASWRIISSIEQKEESKGNTTQVEKIKEYRKKVEGELEGVCKDILNVLDDHLIPAAVAGESKVRAIVAAQSSIFLQHSDVYFHYRYGTFIVLLHWNIGHDSRN